jgi:HAD superfamily hydrolase (TIGR01509 family)
VKRASERVHRRALESAPRAVLFDLNGVISDDESLLYEILAELVSRHGVELTRDRYFSELVGVADREVLSALLGSGHPASEQILHERVACYRERVAGGVTVAVGVREAVHAAARRVPVGLVSGSFREDADAVLAGAGLAGLFAVIVTTEDVPRPKPDPGGYSLALERLDRGLEPEDVLVLEDSRLGIMAAQAAGMRCFGVAGTLPPERLAAADGIVTKLDAAVMAKLLGG